MKRKILTAIYIILTIIAIKLIYNNILNNILINKYNNCEYSENYAKLLTYVNFSQIYVANYNYGNILYKNGEYEKALNEYKKALNGFVPKYKECNIRINYALTICKTVEVDEKNQDSIKKAIKVYESAIDVLTEKGCANKENNNGHNQKAEQLKKDIQKEIDRLKKMQKDEQSDSKKDEKENDTEEKNETIETKIQNIKEEATKNQKEVEDIYKNYKNNLKRKTKNW